MAGYYYECECGFQGLIDDPHGTECPDCGKELEPADDIYD